MKGSMFLLGALLSVGCAPLRSDPLPEIGPPEMGVVETVRRLDVRAGESTWERGALATMTLNPVIVAVAVLATEDELGRSQVREYEIRLAHDQRAVVRSRYVAERGQCVMLRRGMGADYVIIIAHPVAACAAGGVEP